MNLLRGALVFAGLVGAWQVLVWASGVEPFILPGPLSVARALAAELLEGHTVLLITHDPFEALRLGHRIHVMAGRPARLDEPLVLPDSPPRDPASPRLATLHHDLLLRLSAADEAAP